MMFKKHLLIVSLKWQSNIIQQITFIQIQTTEEKYSIINYFDTVPKIYANEMLSLNFYIFNAKLLIAILYSFLSFYEYYYHHRHHHHCHNHDDHEC